MKSNIISKRWIALIFTLLMVVFLIISVIPEARELLLYSLFEKINSGSTVERLFSIKNAWNYFLQYPILGVGWAMVTSHDLIVNLLVSSGIIGFIVFCLLNIVIIKKSHKLLILSRGQNNHVVMILTTLDLGLFIALIVMLIAGIVSGVEFYLGYFYIVYALLIATNILLKKQIYNLNINYIDNITTRQS